MNFLSFRDPLLGNVQKVSDFGALSPKCTVFTEALPSSDVGVSSVCYFLWLMNKETALGLIGQNLGRQRRQNLILGGRKQSQGEAMDSLPEMETG